MLANNTQSEAFTRTVAESETPTAAEKAQASDLTSQKKTGARGFGSARFNLLQTAIPRSRAEKIRLRAVRKTAPFIPRTPQKNPARRENRKVKPFSRLPV